MGSIFDNRAALPLEEEEEKILAPKPIIEQPKQQKSSIFANRAAPEEVEEVKGSSKQLKTQTKTLLLLMLQDVLQKTALVKQKSVMKKLLKNTLRTFVHSM